MEHTDRHWVEDIGQDFIFMVIEVLSFYIFHVVFEGEQFF